MDLPTITLAAAVLVAPALPPFPLLPPQQAGNDAVKQKIAAFERRFQGDVGKTPSPDERKAAVATLATPELIDDPRVSQALVEALRRCEGEEKTKRKSVDEALTRRKEVFVRMNAALSNHREPSSEDIAASKSLSERCQVLLVQMVGLVETHSALQDALGATHGREALELLLATVIGDAGFKRELKIALARNAGACGAPMAAALEKAFSHATDVDDRVALIDAVAGLAGAGPSFDPILVKLLDEGVVEVREHAAAALARRSAREAVEPLIRRLAVDTGATRSRMGFALEELTGQTFGRDFVTWKAWLEHDGARVVAGDVPLPPPAPPRGAAFSKIPLEGRAFVFVVDCSERMLVDASAEHASFKPTEMRAPSRFDVTKKMLFELLVSLRANDRFGIVAFARDAHCWKPRLVAADADAVRAAATWVGELSTTPGTIHNTRDGLAAAFELATSDEKEGRGAGPDSIYLATAGRSQRLERGSGAGERDNSDLLLDDVAARNPGRAIPLHVVAFGVYFDEPLGKLCDENGGTFEWRTQSP